MGNKTHKKKKSMKRTFVERRKKKALQKSSSKNIAQHTTKYTVQNKFVPQELHTHAVDSAKVKDLLTYVEPVVDINEIRTLNMLNDRQAISDSSKNWLSPELHDSDKFMHVFVKSTTVDSGGQVSVNQENVDRTVYALNTLATEISSQMHPNRELHAFEDNAYCGDEVRASSKADVDFMHYVHNNNEDELDVITILDVYGGYNDEGLPMANLNFMSHDDINSKERSVDFTVTSAPRMSSAELAETSDTHGAHFRHSVPESETSNDRINPVFSECDDDLLHDLNSPNEIQTIPLNVDWRRIVDMDFLWKQLNEKLIDHPCSFSALKLRKFLDCGLRTLMYIVCETCGYADSIWSDRAENDMLGINASAVCGTLTSGIGCSTLQEVLAAMGLPRMTHHTYIKYRNRSFEAIKIATEDSMKEAATEEAAIAVQKGHVINGIPCVKVIADGAWAKRSYTGGKHDSLSGVAVIVGYETGKVLFVGVRNKYCAVEAKADQLGKEPSPHVCFKNWGRDQSSTAMEKDIIVEGFMCSLEKHQLIYKTLIADGDASTHQAIRDANPYGTYGVLVEKIECNNHLFRNLCKKIRTASTASFSRTLHASLSMTVAAFRTRIEKSGFQIRRLVERARDCRNEEHLSKEEKRLALVNDIFVIFQHVFGEHCSCGALPFNCEHDADDRNLLLDLRTTGIYPAVYEAVSYLTRYADSLLCKVTNNIAESFNSIVNKGNAGKRTNQCARNSYEIRCLIAVLQHNTQRGLSKVYEGLQKIVPDSVSQLERSRQLHVDRNKSLRHETGKRRRRAARGVDKDYGPASQQPDLPDSTYEILKEKHFSTLRSNQENRVQIERETRSQNNCELWHTLRLDIITASKFGSICRMQKTTSCANMVASIRYPKVLDTDAVRFGIANEQVAKEALAQKLGVEIEPCGLFIDSKIPYLGASPDGLIEPDGIVEIKCPYSAKDIAVENAIALRPNLKSIFDRKKKDHMSKTHIYFYQVQGQLHVTQRNYCIFALWTSVDLKYVKVLRDDEFWSSQMEPMLCRFYMDCLLPEIVDSRQKRSMPIRDPQYILEAKETAKRRKEIDPEMKKKSKGNKLRQESIRKRQKSCENNEGPSIFDCEQPPPQDDVSSARVGISPNPNWVVIDSDDDTTVDVPTMIALIDVTRKSITVDEVIADTLPIRNLLNDSSIDWFLEIVKENSNFHEFNPACYTGYYKCIKPCTAFEPDMQIIGGNKFRHWCCVYYDGSRIKIYDSMCRVEYESLNHDEKRYLERRYGHVTENHMTNIDIPLVTKQPDSYSCGIYSAAMATTIALGGHPEDVQYSQDPNEMRTHFIKIVQNRKLSPFPTAPFQV